ncbi:hypothetical protein [Clostridium sp. 1001283B150210_160208_E6]|uniref:hypothetical protein n=1 Tax=Clostridium sp. 1001283B150210_160208_E6 TaxID=2787129 RepID=UPI0018AAC369|nr:hypothetical protein [Clostridium sp. 1001283B150210_160208_E6]
MIDCKNCLHSGLCMHEDKAEEYIRQHESMRDKCSLFDGEPTCNRFVDNKVLEGNESLKECIERQQKTINELHKKIKENSDKNILDKYKRKDYEPVIFTCQDKKIQGLDERTVTEDDESKYEYFYQGNKIDKRTYDLLKCLEITLI